MKPFEAYLRNLAQIRSTGGGVPETSYYGALETLLNEIGKTIKPKIRCVLTLANRGVGNPDGGLFTYNQFQKASDKAPLPGQLPGHGVIEVKPTHDDAWVTSSGKQVSKYWGKYGLVLVTNYRDFVLIGKDVNGQPMKLETYRLAANEPDFWALAEHPQRAEKSHGQRFTEFLKRAMLHAAPLSAPEDIAWFLASYARDARSRIEGVELPALFAVRKALEEALGLKFEGDKGEHFFRSTLVQTLFYGVFSAWILWSKQNPPENTSVKFDWKQAVWSLHVPMIRALFEQVSAPTKLQPLGLVEPISWASATLNRVDRKSFFATFDQGYAVQYFYEPFLQQFDPKLRKELGVWYTPPEIVKYMVARVDTVLREELEIEDGLADPRVYVLDPCCGTGAYLVEVLHRINTTIEAKGSDALIAQDLKKAAMGRIFGFEILPAPFVVAHLQLGLFLQQHQAPLSYDSLERVAIYLTNALTGWEPPQGPKQHLIFPELEEERDAAEEIKREKPILVILGNPPYNAFAGVSPAEEEGLVEPYKENLNKPISKGGWDIKKFNLDDLYVRFFRLAERRIVEGKPGIGVVCFISNFSYLKDPSFVVMRKRFLTEFDSLWFDCMNGDSRETGKLTPDGKPDPSVFSTEYHNVGIHVGTAIGLMVRKDKRAKTPTIRYRDFWGVTKRTDLLESLKVSKLDGKYKRVNPAESNRFLFRPSNVTADYLSWPSVDALADFFSLGILENRKDALVSIDRLDLEERMRIYYDATVDWETVVKKLDNGLTENAARFDAKRTRLKVLEVENFNSSSLRRVLVRPMDQRWCYHTSVRPLWNEPRPLYSQQCWKDNPSFVCRRKGIASPEGVPFLFTSSIGLQHSLNTDAYYFPLSLRFSTEKKVKKHDRQFPLYGAKPMANLSATTRNYFAKLGIKNPDTDASSLIWMHALAIGYSPTYLNENADGIRQDWPHIPLPASKKVLEESAELGRKVAALLNTESHVKGVISGVVRSELKLIAVITKIGGGAIDLSAGELDLVAGWGHLGKGDIIMPGKGKMVERDYAPDEVSSTKQGVASLDLTFDQVLSHLGKTTCDIYLNNVAFWQNIPVNVWDYTIGGYQIIKKWLSYREREILGRGLTMDEAREVTNMARRIAAILVLQPMLDENYKVVKQSSYVWPAS
jgi:hypothetical protein